MLWEDHEGEKDSQWAEVNDEAPAGAAILRGTAKVKILRTGGDALGWQAQQSTSDDQGKQNEGKQPRMTPVQISRATTEAAVVVVTVAAAWAGFGRAEEPIAKALIHVSIILTAWGTI